MRLDNQDTQTVMLAVKDISQQKRQVALIETLSHHDTLSGLLNRPSTTKARNQALTDKKAIITLYIIATRLREIYEIYGHQAYDNAVKHIADALKQQFPQAEIGRLSENEFIVFTDKIEEEKINVCPISPPSFLRPSH
jgi:FOG: GGDEF domain